eukprot:18565-Heterococcus_DN1.PRE.1
MELAAAPGKNLMMNAFMMYMSGSSINIFSIMITAMLLSSTTSAVLNTNKGQFCDIDVRLQLERKSESFCVPAISAAMAYTAYVWAAAASH